MDYPEETCCTCLHFDSTNSFCRRYPPTTLLVDGVFNKTVFPKIPFPKKDYCSEYININTVEQDEDENNK